MSKQHGARQQKKLAKQKAKKDSKRRELARRNSPDPNIRLRSADTWPILECLVPKSLWEAGIGSLLIARRTTDGHVAIALYLVDAFCLGVKNVVWRFLTPGEFDEFLEDFHEEQGPHQRVTPEYFAKLVYRAADYGQSLGFPPHHDFRHAQRLLSGIDPSQCSDEFDFGKDGKPLYLPGPNDSMEKIQFVLTKLSATNTYNDDLPGMLGSTGIMNLLESLEGKHDADGE